MSAKPPNDQDHQLVHAKMKVSTKSKGISKKKGPKSVTLPEAPVKISKTKLEKSPVNVKEVIKDLASLNTDEGEIAQAPRSNLSKRKRRGESGKPLEHGDDHSVAQGRIPQVAIQERNNSPYRQVDNGLSSKRVKFSPSRLQDSAPERNKDSKIPKKVSWAD